MSETRPRTSSRARSTSELYTLDVAGPRAGFVQYQLGLARLSLSLQVPRAARAALMVLSRTDFPADPDTAEVYLAALRDPGLSADDIQDAFQALADLAEQGYELALSPTAG